MSTDEGKRPDHDGGGNDNGSGKPRIIEIEVNGKPVEMPKAESTGRAIKEAAVAQGVNIQVGFMLQQELPNGSSKVVGDEDIVQLRKHLRFTAIAPDDNS